MPDPGADIGQLIADAKLVAAYGVRTGRLPDDTLISAVAAAEAALAKDPPGEIQATELAAALNRGMQAIAPVTLLDLGSAWRPYPDTRARRAGRVVFAVFAGLLILATGNYTLTYTQTNAILGQLIDIQSRNVRDKAERLFRIFVQNYKELFALDTESKDAVVFEPYLTSYEDLLALNERINTYVPLANDVICRAQSVPLLSPLLRKLRLDNAPDGSDPCVSLAVSYSQKADYGEGPPDARQSSAAEPAATPPGATSSAATTGAGAPEPQGEFQQGVTMLSQKQAELIKFLYISGVDPASLTNPLSGPIYQCQRELTLLGFWVLPLLYGLLGATVFQMRSILNPMVPDPSPERLFLRLALGGFAGISTLLVFGPTPQKIVEGTSSLIGPFGLAFLLGFSVDLFFSALDRVVGAVSQSLSPATSPRK